MDFTYYDTTGNMTKPPPPFQKLLKKETLDSVMDFVKAIEIDQVFFGINAGPWVRNASQGWAWNPEHALPLMRYMKHREFPIAGYEFSNEPNLFPGVFPEYAQKNNSASSEWIFNGTRWAIDFAIFKATVLSVQPNLTAVCCDVAYVPLLGQLYWDFMTAFTKAGGLEFVDHVTWHFYPLLGSAYNKTFPPFLDPFYAESWKLTDAFFLDQVGFWASVLEETVSKSPVNYKGHLWLGETGAVVGGGQNGITNRFVDSLEYLDKLGQLSQTETQRHMFRQTLCGSPDQYYALISHDLVAHPTYFTTLVLTRLWRKHKSEEGSWYAVETATANPSVLRSYGFAFVSNEKSKGKGVSIATDKRPREMIVFAININNSSQQFNFSVVWNSSTIHFPMLFNGTLFELTSDSLVSPYIHLNGVRLQVDKDGVPPATFGVPVAVRCANGGCSIDKHVPGHSIWILHIEI